MQRDENRVIPFDPGGVEGVFLSPVGVKTLFRGRSHEGRMKAEKAAPEKSFSLLKKFLRPSSKVEFLFPAGLEP
jgi:hypothetical protein